jgi:hypothetical protein
MHIMSYASAVLRHAARWVLPFWDAKVGCTSPAEKAVTRANAVHSKSKGKGGSSPPHPNKPARGGAMSSNTRWLTRSA